MSRMLCKILGMFVLLKAFDFSKYDLTLLILGAAFSVLGIVLSVPGVRMLAADAQWWRTTTTTGRVIAVEWFKRNQENQLRISYGYQDGSGTIYHTTASMARRRGKINLEPGTPVAVVYQPGDHSQSRLAIEVGTGEWMTLLGIGVLELLFGCMFIFAAGRRKPVGKELDRVAYPQEL